MVEPLERKWWQPIPQWLNLLEKHNQEGYDPKYRLFVKVNRELPFDRKIKVTSGSDIDTFCRNLSDFQKKARQPVIGIFNEIELYCDNRSANFLVGFYSGFRECRFLASEGRIEIPKPILITDFSH